MARLELPIYIMSRENNAAVVDTPVLAVDGAQFQNDGQTIVRLHNTSGGIKTVTFLTPTTLGNTPSNVVADYAFALPAGPALIRFIGPWPTNEYNQADNKVYIDCSVDGVNITVLRLPVE